mgnify:CR=1 FL=1
MRSLTIISILLALGIGVFTVQKMFMNSAPRQIYEPAEYSPALGGVESEKDYLGECEDHKTRTPDCEIEIESGFESEEQGEMAEQRGNSYDTMMKSFDDKYDKYKDQINGR